MHYSLFLMRFKYKKGPKAALKSLEASFQGNYESITPLVADDNKHALFVIASKMPLDEKKYKLFSLSFVREIIFSYISASTVNNFFVAAVIPNYTQWEVLNEAPDHRKKESKALPSEKKAQEIRFSEFRPSHSVVVLETNIPVSLIDATTILSVIRPSKKHEAHIFNSASIPAKAKK